MQFVVSILSKHECYYCLSEKIKKKEVRVNKLIIFSVLVMGVSLAHAQKTDKQLCEEVLAASMYNKLLEDTCGFKGGVSKNFKDLFDYGKCTSHVPTARINWYAKEVTQDTKKRYLAHGKEDFCEKNLDRYAELVEEMK